MIIAMSVLFLMAAMWFLANRLHRPPIGCLSTQNTDHLTPLGAEITVTTWNIGFAALGAGADFFVDGSKNMRALPKSQIQTAAMFIADRLADFHSDVVLLQENAVAGFLTRGVNVNGAIKSRLTNYAHCFWPDLKTLFAPKPFNILHGMSNYTRGETSECSTLSLPQDPLYYYGFLKKYYGAIVQRFPIEGQAGAWVVINIHLSAFDKGANVRQRQLTNLLEYAEQEYLVGNYVVIGGDWNMRLSATKFPHSTPKSDLFEIFDFPQDKLPKGWMLGVDEHTASLRSLSKPYIKGETFTTIVDGFVVSPNVRVEAVITDNLAFEHTDHHPVTGRFSAVA